MDFSFFEREAEAFTAALNRERYLYRAGVKPALELEPIYERHPELCSIDTYGWLHDQPLEAKPLRWLLDFVASNMIGQATWRMDEQLAEAEARAAVEWDGAALPFRAASLVLVNEPDAERRHALEELVRAETGRLSRLRCDRYLAAVSIAGELGFADYGSMLHELRGLEPAVLVTAARTILERTADMYHQALSDQSIHHTLDGEDLWSSDLEWVRRGTEYDGLFAAEYLLPALHGTVAGLGLRLEEQSNVRLDLESRPLKSACPFCIPIAVPDEIVIVSTPRGGRLDFEGLLQQLGRAESLATVDRTQPFVHRRLGDIAVREGYGLLLRGMASEPAWLGWRLEIDDPRDVIRLAAFERLYELRRVAAAVLCEQELHALAEPEAVLEELPERLAEELTELLGVRFFAEESVGWANDRLLAAERLRSMMLEPQIRAFLKHEYDEEWFRSERAGRFLVDRWREGNRYTADELARFMGFERLSGEAWLEQLSEVVGV